MEEIKLIGNVDDFDSTIVGSFRNEIKILIKEFETKGFYTLSKDNLTNETIDADSIKLHLNLTNYLNATKLQNRVIANIFNLINKGYKKIVINELLTYIDLNVKEALLKYLKTNNVRFINITNDMEDTLLADYLIVIFMGKVALEGNTIDVLKEEKILSRMGISLPFMVDLSIQLKYYGLVDKIYLNKEELVSVLWK